MARAYAEKYFGRFTKSGNTYRIELHLDGYGGGTTEITNLMPDPVIMKRRTAAKGGSNDVVLGSELEFNFYSSLADADQFNDIYTGEWKDWRVLYYRDATLIWQGWIKPENLTREFIADQYELSISATDGLADLSNIEFIKFSDSSVYTDRVTALTTVKRCIEHLEIELDFKIQLSVYETVLMTSSENAIFKCSVDSERFIKTIDGILKQDNCLTVLSEALRPFDVVMFQDEGIWWIQSKRERNSPVFLYDYSALTQTSRNITDVSIDITNYDFKNTGELQRFKPIGKHGTTFQDKNSGENLVANGDFETGGSWTPQNLISGTISGGVFITVLTTGNSGYFQSDNFNLATIPANSTITFTFSFGLQSVAPSGGYFDNSNPLVTCKLFKGSSEISPSTAAQFTTTFTFVQRSTTFPISDPGSDYNIRFYINYNTNNNYTANTIHFDDVSSRTNFEDAEAITTDTTIVVTNDDITSAFTSENKIFFGDSLQTNDLGALKIGGTNTEFWHRYGKTDTKTIQTLNALNIVVDNSAYKDYLRVIIMDVDDNIRYSDRIKINSSYYRINSYTRSHINRTLTVELEEQLTTDPTFSEELLTLNSIAGVSQTVATTGGAASSAIINDGTTSTASTWSSTKIDADKEDSFSKNTGFNKNFGTGSGTVSEGDHDHDSDYEPIDSNLTKDNVAEVITSEWKFSGGIKFDAADEYIILLANDANTGFFWDNTERELFLMDDGTERFMFDIDSGRFHSGENIVGYSSSVSDINRKENIVSINTKDALDIILKSRGVLFNYKGEDKLHSNYIAQEMEILLPHIISEGKILNGGDKEYKMLSSTEIIPYITEGMKEQQIIIDNLIKEVDKLKNNNWFKQILKWLNN